MIESLHIPSLASNPACPDYINFSPKQQTKRSSAFDVVPHHHVVFAAPRAQPLDVREQGQGQDRLEQVREAVPAGVGAAARVRGVAGQGLGRGPNQGQVQALQEGAQGAPRGHQEAR